MSKESRMIPKLLRLPLVIKIAGGIAGFIVKTIERCIIFEIYPVE